MKSSFFISSVTAMVVASAMLPAWADAYDPAENPSVQLQAALSEASSSNKRVLLIAGGDWCRWCLALEKFVAANADVKEALDRNFITVHAYYGEKNKNAEFFSKLPKAKGYPHFWVIDKGGAVVKSVDTGPLENGKDGYDKARVLEFIREMKGS